MFEDIWSLRVSGSFFSLVITAFVGDVFGARDCVARADGLTVNHPVRVSVATQRT